MSNMAACPKFERLAPTPYTFSGNLLLRPVDGCGVDLLWIVTAICSLPNVRPCKR